MRSENVRRFQGATTKEYSTILSGGATKKSAMFSLPQGRNHVWLSSVLLVAHEAQASLRSSLLEYNHTWLRSINTGVDAVPSSLEPSQPSLA